MARCPRISAGLRRQVTERDGRYVIYSQIDETASDLMLVDGLS